MSITQAYYRNITNVCNVCLIMWYFFPALGIPRSGGIGGDFLYRRGLGLLYNVAKSDSK